MDDPFKYGLLAGLAIALLVAAFTDLRSRQIGNKLNAVIALGAPLFWWASGLALWPDIAMQVGFGLAVFAVLAGLFALGAIGGGDVKLLAALALWLEPLWFFRLLMVMAIVGGALAIGLAAWHLKRKRKERIDVPYGIAIACGGLWVMSVQHGLLHSSVAGAAG